MEADFGLRGAGKPGWVRGRKPPEEITNLKKEKPKCLSYP